jgi:hypothetical protein
MPPPIAICTIDDIAARWLTGNKSPSRENTSGKQPPTDIPVNILTRKNCHNSVTYNANGSAGQGR